MGELAVAIISSLFIGALLGAWLTTLLTTSKQSNLAARIRYLEIEKQRLTAWVEDLQSGMYVNCVYCGHRYGPEDKLIGTMGEMLKHHVEQCPQHPMSALKVELREVVERVFASYEGHFRAGRFSVGYRTGVRDVKASMDVALEEAGIPPKR